MRTILKNLFFFSVIVFTLSACGAVEEPDNEITDPQGVTIELTWSNSATDASIDTDLDFYIRQNFKSLLQSTNFRKFESIDIVPALLNDGTYTLEVFVDDIDRVTNYSIKITGKSTQKTYSQSFGPINGNDINSTLKPMSVTIEGNLYRVF
jgi:excinuclease UvrABC helicase subunit UvrB